MSGAAMSTLTKDDVHAALAELYVNRSKAAGFKYVRSILTTHGNGANNITELDPAYYGAVYAAAGGKPLELDEPEPEPEPWDVDEPTEPDRPLSGRVQTPLVRDLEKRLAAARAKTKQSKPSGPVNLGDRSLPGDRPDDAGEPQMPSGERMVR
jgi:hypothetical protein